MVTTNTTALDGAPAAAPPPDGTEIPVTFTKPGSQPVEVKVGADPLATGGDGSQLPGPDVSANASEQQIRDAQQAVVQAPTQGADLAPPPPDMGAPDAATIDPATNLVRNGDALGLEEHVAGNTPDAASNLGTGSLITEETPMPGVIQPAIPEPAGSSQASGEMPLPSAAPVIGAEGEESPAQTPVLPPLPEAAPPLPNQEETLTVEQEEITLEFAREMLARAKANVETANKTYKNMAAAGEKTDRAFDMLTKSVADSNTWAYIVKDLEGKGEVNSAETVGQGGI